MDQLLPYYESELACVTTCANLPNAIRASPGAC
jgi:hypothetical protein